MSSAGSPFRLESHGLCLFSLYGCMIKGHAANQGLHVLGQCGSARRGFPPPQLAKALTIPTRKGLRFHDA